MAAQPPYMRDVLVVIGGTLVVVGALAGVIALLVPVLLH
jgi:hypothetical protein